MGEIVNLRRVKRTRARDLAAKAAAESRAKHGLTKAVKQAEAKQRARLEQLLDGAELARDGETGEVPR